MSKMQELYEKVSKDAVLQEKYEAIIKDAEKAGEATKENLIAFAKEAGYDVTLEEMQAFFKGMMEKQKGELSDAELDMVAGGKAEIGIVFSLISLGMMCAVVSIFGVVGDATNLGPGCGEMLNKDLVDVYW